MVCDGWKGKVWLICSLSPGRAWSPWCSPSPSHRYRRIANSLAYLALLLFICCFFFFLGVFIFYFFIWFFLFLLHRDAVNVACTLLEHSVYQEISFLHAKYTHLFNLQLYKTTLVVFCTDSGIALSFWRAPRWMLPLRRRRLKCGPAFTSVSFSEVLLSLSIGLYLIQWDLWLFGVSAF